MTTHHEDEDPEASAEDMIWEMEKSVNCMINDARDGLDHYDKICWSYDPPPKGVPFHKETETIYYWKRAHYNGDWEDDVPNNNTVVKYEHCLKELLSKTRKKKKLNIIKKNTDMDKQTLHCIIKNWILSDVTKLYENCSTQEQKEMLNYTVLQLHRLKYE